MGLYLGVAECSQEDPKFIHLTYTSPGLSPEACTYFQTSARNFPRPQSSDCTRNDPSLTLRFMVEGYPQTLLHIPFLAAAEFSKP